MQSSRGGVSFGVIRKQRLPPQKVERGKAGPCKSFHALLQVAAVEKKLFVLVRRTLQLEIVQSFIVHSF